MNTIYDKIKKATGRVGDRMVRSAWSLVMAGAVVTTLTACDDWFDVRPKSQIKESDMYKNESGFRDATLGIYTLMADKDAYGGNMTMGLLDVLAQQYTNVGVAYSGAMSYSYVDVNSKPMVEAMWKKCYEAVANCNHLLAQVEGANGGVLSDQMRRIVKGEALATRAYLHFDMLRLYAPSYMAGKDKKGVPYVAEATVNPQPSPTVSEMCDKLVADLVEARSLLKDVDPICQPGYSERISYDSQSYLSNDGFLLYRTSRLNYYGVTALLARICLYKQDMTAALQYAKEVIDSGKFDLISDALLNQDANEAGTSRDNYTFMMSVAKHEYISGLYVYNLKEGLSDTYFRDNQSASLRTSDIRKQQVFGADGLDYDVRAKRMFAVPNGSSNEYTIKYLTGTQIPLLKIGEMYLIAAEASGDPSYLQTLRVKRGYHNAVVDKANLMQELRAEYQREFYAEGQLFFYYKRMNLAQIPYSTVAASDAVYVLPQPDDELEFGSAN